METARMKEEEGEDTRHKNKLNSSMKYGRKKRGRYGGRGRGGSPKQGLTSAKDPTIGLIEGCESPTIN